MDNFFHPGSDLIIGSDEAAMADTKLRRGSSQSSESEVGKYLKALTTYSMARLEKVDN